MSEQLTQETRAEGSPMDADTLAALRGSIAKWEGIINGTEVDKGVINCPLCQMFVMPTDYCEGCPVYAVTSRQGCRKTPYDHWHAVNPWPQQHIDWRAAETEDHIVAAKAERDFLKSLLPPGVEP